MSYSPCQGCRSTNNGRLFYAYFQTFLEDDMLRYRLRLCRDCFAETVPQLQELADKEIDGTWIPSDDQRRHPPAPSLGSSPSLSAATSAAKRSSSTRATR